MRARLTFTATLVTAAVVTGLTVGTSAAAEPRAGDHAVAEQVAPGIEYSTYAAATGHGTTRVHLLTVDLTEPGISLGLLNAGKVAKTGVITSLADRAGAVAGVNGDFFNIGETGAPVGPAILDGKDLKGGVPGKQRHGPSLPPGTSNDDVFGVTDAGIPTVTSLSLDGKATGPDGSFELQGLNQYAITVDGVGVFDAEWGTASRKRATCGTDDNRKAPCSDRTREVEIVDGVVTRVTTAPGSGQIADDATVLVARDDGVDHLAGLSEGDMVDVDYRLNTPDGATLATAVGGMPIILNGEHLPLDDNANTLAPRTAAGISLDRTTVYLVAVDGRSSSSVGATLKSLALIMTTVGAYDAINFDGGGSTTLVARKPDSTATSIRNSPSDGSQRSVSTGLGVFYSG